MKKNLIIAFTLFFTQASFSQNISSPIDHDNLSTGYFNLEYEFGSSYNPELPTIIVVADAQQFYVRPGRIKKIQNELFSKDFNVLGVIPRSSNQDLIDKVQLVKDDKIDWELAYLIFKSYQFINDLELVIKEVLSKQQNIYLYGQSGGAFLITEYLSQFPNSKVKKVFIGASVNPIIEHKLGIIHDDFHRSYLLKNRIEKEKLDTILSQGFFDRKLVVNLFQRQNFFVELTELHKERSALMDHLYTKDTAKINNLKRIYQIDAINNLFESERGVSIRVRLAEFIYPLLEDWRVNKHTFYPELENSYNIASPLLELESPDFQMVEVFDENSFRNYRGEVFILSGRYDHVADYRSSIYLSGLLEHGFLFIADDDHTFKKLKSNDDYGKLAQDFFLSTNNNQWAFRYYKYRWRE